MGTGMSGELGRGGPVARLAQPPSNPDSLRETPSPVGLDLFPTPNAPVRLFPQDLESLIQTTTQVNLNPEGLLNQPFVAPTNVRPLLWISPKLLNQFVLFFTQLSEQLFPRWDFF